MAGCGGSWQVVWQQRCAGLCGGGGGSRLAASVRWTAGVEALGAAAGEVAQGRSGSNDRCAWRWCDCAEAAAVAD